MQNTMLNLDTYPGTSCSSWRNGVFPLISGLGRGKDLNSAMWNSHRVTYIDSASCHSRHDMELSDSNFHERCTSVQSGDENSNHMAKLDSQSKPASSVTSSGVPFSPPSIDFRQPFACIPYAEPCQGGMLFSYGSHAVLNPNGHANPRVPLPRQPSDEELIYVNPKQYHGILRRRHLRAKLEAQNKLNKGRKPYLHESRHLHAMRRVRGSGGRFVNTKQVQQHHEKALHTPFQKSGNKTDLTTSPSSNVANLFCQNQSNYSNQNNYSSHNSYNREFSGEHMHQWVSTRLP